MKNLEWFIAQTQADIVAIDEKITILKAEAEALRTEQVELHKVLKKLKASDVVEEPVVE